MLDSDGRSEHVAARKSARRGSHGAGVKLAGHMHDYAVAARRPHGIMGGEFGAAKATPTRTNNAPRDREPVQANATAVELEGMRVPCGAGAPTPLPRPPHVRLPACLRDGVRS